MTQEILRLSRAYDGVDEDANKERLGLELYDMIWNLCDQANIVGIDLETACARKMAINREREW